MYLSLSLSLSIIPGSFFGGPPATVSWWSEVFYAHHDHYLHKGHFVGKDQTLINSLFLLFPSRIIGVWVFDPSTQTGLSQLSAISPGSCGSPWFYYQFFLASKKERQAMSNKWMKDLEDQAMWPFNSWNWWLKRRECKLTQAVCMWDMLYDAFGKDWNEKKHRKCYLPVLNMRTLYLIILLGDWLVHLLRARTTVWLIAEQYYLSLLLNVLRPRRQATTESVVGWWKRKKKHMLSEARWSSSCLPRREETMWQ